jgi:hypothetical protein
LIYSIYVLTGTVTQRLRSVLGIRVFGFLLLLWFDLFLLFKNSSGEVVGEGDHHRQRLFVAIELVGNVKSQSVICFQ